MPIASPMRTSPSPQTFPICPAPTAGRGTAAPCSKTAIAVTFRSWSSPIRSRSRVRAVPVEHPHVRDLLAAVAAFDLEHRARGRTVGIAAGRREQLGDAAHQRFDAGARDRRTEEHGMRPGLPGQGAERAAQLGVRDGRSRRRGTRRAAHRRESASSSAMPAANAAFLAPYGTKPASRVPRSRTDPIARIAGVSFSVTARRTRASSAPPRSILFTKMSVGMRSRCSVRIRTRGLRLHPLDGRDDEHGAVEHVQHPLDLGANPLSCWVPATSSASSNAWSRSRWSRVQPPKRSRFTVRPGCSYTRVMSERECRARVPRAAGLQDRRDHVPPARLLGAHRSRAPVGDGRERQRHATPLLVPRSRRVEGHQADARRRHLVAVGAQGRRVAAQLRRRISRRRASSSTVATRRARARPTSRSWISCAAARAC